jgi:hypothetical protein
MSWVIEHSQHKGNAFVVLLMIANHARSDGSGAWPSVKTLAGEARISPRAVQYTIRRLERSGELETGVSLGPGGSNLYSLPKYAKSAYAKLAPPTQHACAPPTQIPAPPPAIAIAPEPSLKQPSLNRPIKTSARIHFAIPSLGEITAYCQERGNKVDPQNFFDHYTANGWLVGRNHMKDWRAAVRTWEKNAFNPAQRKESLAERNQRAFEEMERRAKHDDADVQ